MEMPRERGVSKAPFFERKCDTKMKFLEDEGGRFKKNLQWEGYGYFLAQHNIYLVHCHENGNIALLFLTQLDYTKILSSF